MTVGSDFPLVVEERIIHNLVYQIVLLQKQ
jgi:hypothetical protein